MSRAPRDCGARFERETAALAHRDDERTTMRSRVPIAALLACAALAGCGESPTDKAGRVAVETCGEGGVQRIVKDGGDARVEITCRPSSHVGGVGMPAAGTMVPTGLPVPPSSNVGGTGQAGGREGSTGGRP